MAVKPLGQVQHKVTKSGGTLDDVPKGVTEYTLFVPEGLTVEVDGEEYVGPYMLIRTGDATKAEIKKVDGEGVVTGEYHAEA